ncbi:beta strand repeat-containing protein [Salinicola salarius]|uniref:beta strand repeat-containing protein n=1 Tax=Salinicola salarius TaxID=430457 RepID=UPI00117A6BE3|nr:calcium-binding protein [Salinicola salarius]
MASTTLSLLQGEVSKMALTEQQQQSLLGVTSFMFDYAPDQASYDRFASILEQNPSFYDLGTDLAKTDAFQSQYDGTTQGLIDLVFGRLNITEGTQAYTRGTDFITQRLDAGVSEGQVLMEVGEKLLQDTPPEGLEDAAAILQNKIAVSQAYLESGAEGYSSDTIPDLLSGVTADEASVQAAQDKIDAVVNEGETFTLTADDAGTNVVLTANNDTVEANSAALVGTSIIDQGGNDTLNATLTSQLLAGTELQGVENVNLNWDAFSTATVDADGITGVDGGSNITLTSSKTGFLGNATVTNTGTNNVTAGEGMGGSLTVSDVENSTVDAGAATTVTVNGAGNNNDSTVINAGTATTSITTTATENVEVTAGEATTSVSVTGYNTATVDAAEATSITLAGGNATDTATVTIGADASVTNAEGSLTLNIADGKTVTVDDIGESLTVSGEGDVTLKSVALDGEEVTNAKSDGSLTVESTATTSVDLSKVEADTIRLATANSAGATLASGANVVVGADLGTSVFGVGTETDADSINMTFTESQTSTTFSDATPSDFETVNIVAAAEQATGTTVTDLTFGALVAAGNTVNLSGTNDVEVTLLTAKTLDATELDGALDVTTAAAALDVTVAGSQGENDVTFNSAATKAAFVGQENDDKVTFGTLTATTEATAVTAGGNDTITANVTSLTTGSLVVEAGAGDDVVNLTADGSTGNIVLQFGEGNDTLQIADSADLTGANLTVAGVEKLEIGANNVSITGGQFAQLGSVEVAGSGILTVDASAATQATTIDGSQVGLEFGTSATFSFIGSAQNDTITGTDAADTINGGAGADTMTGGARADSFIIQSGLTAVSADTVTDFGTGDTVAFDDGVGGTVTIANATKGTAAVADFAAAKAAAETAFTGSAGTPAIDASAQQVGSDLWVFADVDGNGTFDNADSVVKLTGVALADFDVAADIA